MPAGRPKSNRKQASMRIDKTLWDKVLPKMAKVMRMHRTDIIEKLIRDEAIKIGVMDAPQEEPTNI